MSGYRYRCRLCGVETPCVSTRAAAEDLRTLHRATEHGGLPPADGIQQETGADDSSPGVSDCWTALVLLGLMALGALILITRWLRHLL